jgi:hypothetical protein
MPYVGEENMKVWAVMLAVAAAGVGSSSSRAQVNSCDPSAFEHFVIQSTDLRTNIIYAEKLNQKQSGSQSSSAGIDILGYVGLSGSQQQEYLDALSKIVDLNISSDDKKFLLVSEMDAEGRKAYEDCIAGRSFYIIPPDGSMLGNEFTTQVHLSASPMKGLVPLELTVTGGQFSAFPTTFIPNNDKTHLFRQNWRKRNWSSNNFTKSRPAGKPYCHSREWFCERLYNTSCTAHDY